MIIFSACCARWKSCSTKPGRALRRACSPRHPSLHRQHAETQDLCLEYRPSGGLLLGIALWNAARFVRSRIRTPAGDVVVTDHEDGRQLRKAQSRSSTAAPGLLDAAHVAECASIQEPGIGRIQKGRGSMQ